jgi:hypothetical protein
LSTLLSDDFEAVEEFDGKEGKLTRDKALFMSHNHTIMGSIREYEFYNIELIDTDIKGDREAMVDCRTSYKAKLIDSSTMENSHLQKVSLRLDESFIVASKLEFLAAT